ncbi:DUF6391 domain-containing protein [Thermorudis peleae]|uniref:DUF6391 domain-containing protein n=1 Tax=Thermorudis peleae TaxID=1382356 RepID=UPI00056DEA7B|nr:DUF6391 domain-containing protein [Thermorudis peleae]
MIGLMVLFLAAFLIAGFLFLTVTVGMTLSALVTLVTAPGQLWRLLRDRQLRQNHALEHATINVLEERFGPSQLTGLARHDGFYIRGAVSPALVLDAAHEALQRLQAGERRLAIHPRCGTTLLASQLVLAVTFLAVLIILHTLSIWPFLAGLLAAIVLGPRLSPFLQRWITTDAHVDQLTIEGIALRSGLGFGWTSLLVPTLFVRTTTKPLRFQQPADEADIVIITPNRDVIIGGRYRVH